ncbi:MAG TPA: hypothetical protein VIT68_00945 [Candidatus Gracilibacteria bacterium]
MPIIKTCVTSGQIFTVTDQDLAFCDKIGVPPPTLCPEERQRRRLAWRNERQLYKRTCDGTGKSILSNFTDQAPFPIYEKEYW